MRPKATDSQEMKDACVKFEGRCWEDATTNTRDRNDSDAAGLGAAEMRAMFSVMLEDSMYLDSCAQRRRVCQSRHRFTACEQEDVMDAGVPTQEETSPALERQFELSMPPSDNTFTEDELFFSEFLDEMGEGTATRSTCRLLMQVMAKKDSDGVSDADRALASGTAHKSRHACLSDGVRLKKVQRISMDHSVSSATIAP